MQKFGDVNGSRIELTIYCRLAQNELLETCRLIAQAKKGVKS
jgi:hypothetical protein